MNKKEDCAPFYGKYRGTVENNVDPEGRGRLLVSVPDVLGLSSQWAEACTPLAGPAGAPMGVYFVPPIGGGVWVEFENGDPDYAVWAGCRYGSPADPPTIAKLGLPFSPSIVLQTAGQNKIVISDTPGPQGGIMLQSMSGVTLIVNDTGIYISDGKGGMINVLGGSVVIGCTGAPAALVVK